MEGILGEVNDISDSVIADDLLVSLCKSMVLQGDIKKAVRLSKGIVSKVSRNRCWQEIAYLLKSDQGMYLDLFLFPPCDRSVGWEKPLYYSIQLEDEEIRKSYIKGWALSLSASDTNLDCFIAAAPMLVDDTESLSNMLQLFALNDLFIGDKAGERVMRLNDTFDIQWAIDSVDRLFSVGTVRRFSTNFDDWIDDIPDEDDRDQIRLWARQVTKGRLSEAEFAEKVAELDER
jgi:hypothetical protein